MMVTSDDTERLQSLAETHVIAENAMEVVSVEESKPIHTILLI